MSKLNRARKLLEQGLQHHRAGHLDAADRAYISASELDPRNADALNLRGLVALSRMRVTAALTLFRKATALHPENPGFWANLGNAALESADFAEAENAFRHASKLAPGNPDFSIGIARALAAGGQLKAAETLLQDIVLRHPGHAPAWFCLARNAEKMGQVEPALEGYQRALQADHRYGIAHLNLGVLLQARQRLDEAEQCYRQALNFNAPRETALINLTSVLCSVGKLDEAERLARAGVVEFPGSAELHRLWAAACVQRGCLGAAAEPAKQALAADPENVKLQMTLGGILFESGQVLQGLRRLDDTLLAHPDDPDIAYVVGVTRLTAGNFREGWQGFMHREVRRAKMLTRPWLNDHLPQRLESITIGLLREQGLGDELFFLRFTPWLKRLGARVVYQTDPRLASMLERVPSIDQVLTNHASEDPVAPLQHPGCAVNLLVGDLPPALYQHDSPGQCEIKPPPNQARPRQPPCPMVFYPEIPAPLALKPLPERVAIMRDQLLRFGPPPYLALTWRGGIAPHEQKGKWWTLFKNIALEAFGNMLAGLPFTLLAVQRKPLPEEIDVLEKAAGAPIHDLCAINDDLEQMLALLDIVDDYVGVSNTNMHMRAGLNRGARVLVPRPSEWRWMAYGNTSPWFPGFHVYRQGLDGDWQNALDTLRAHLLNAAPPPRSK